MKSKQRQGRRQAAHGQALESIRPQVAGTDLGSREHWVSCPPSEDGRPHVQTFGTTTAQLCKLADWLEAEDVESVALESTHGYWIPQHERLEERGFEALLATATQLKHLPGRKSDMLHSCGLLRGSLRPHEAVVRLREQEPPQHPNAAKEKAIRGRGDQPPRTALYRYAAVDLTRIDGISGGAAHTVMTEVS